MSRQLNARQERFILEYLKDQNASAAAIRAGYSAKTRGTHAAELMRNPLIQERINLEMGDMYADLGVTALNLMRLESRLVHFDPIHLLDAEGKVLPLHQIPEEYRCLLTVSYTTNAKGQTTLSVRMPNRQQALANLEKRFEKFMALQLELLRANHGEPEHVEEEEEVAEPAPPQWVRPPLDQLSDEYQPTPGEIAAARAVVQEMAQAEARQGGAAQAETAVLEAAPVKRGCTLADDPLWPLNHPRQKPEAVQVQPAPETAKPGLLGGLFGKTAVR